MDTMPQRTLVLMATSDMAEGVSEGPCMPSHVWRWQVLCTTSLVVWAEAPMLSAA